MIVVDASVLVAVLLQADAAAMVEARLRTAGAILHAPDLVDLEVVNALRRKTVRPGLARESCEAVFATYRDLVLRRHSHVRFIDRIWALRHNITPYDATYVALAEYLDAPLLTRDRRLANAAGHTARIEVI